MSMSQRQTMELETRLRGLRSAPSPLLKNRTLRAVETLPADREPGFDWLAWGLVAIVWLHLSLAAALLNGGKTHSLASDSQDLSTMIHAHRAISERLAKDSLGGAQLKMEENDFLPASRG